MALSIKMQEYIEEVSRIARKKVEEDLGISSGMLSGSDIKKIIEYYKGSIKLSNDESKVLMNQDEDGKFIILLKCEFEISAAEDPSQIEKMCEDNREVIFHELGHVFLNPILTGNTEKQAEHSRALTVEELSVNYFSRAFLMPVDLFTETVFSQTFDNICNFYTVSQKFGVSSQAVVARGKDLMIWR